MAKKAKTEDTLNEVLRDFKSSWDYCAGSWHKRWEDNYFLYNNQRVKRGYQGITDTFVPMAFGTVETLTASLFGTKPRFDFLAPSNKPDQKTDILNALLDHYWDKDQWSVKVINTGRDMFKLGIGVSYFYWENDHPCMINVPIRDFFFDPTASDGETMRFMGRRFLTTKEILETFEIVDLDAKPDKNGNFPMKKKYINLDKVDEGSEGDDTDKQQKDMWYGSTVTKTEGDGQIEVIEYWTEDKVISVANRNTVIEETENYYKAKARANGAEYPKGIMPFAWARDYVDPSLFLAKGEIDFIADEQELLNDITNQNIDSITYTLNQMYTLDPKYAHMINQIENLPGAVYPVERDALVPIQQRPIPADAFNERQNIKNEIRETTASNEVVRGVGSQSGSDPTATEINAQIAGAGQRINLKVTQIENEYFHRVARIVLEMVKRYVTEPMMVRIVGKDGANWELFNPDDFQEDYEPRVQLDITVEQKKRDQAEQSKELLAAFLNDPDVNQQELKKLVFQRAYDLDPDEVEVLMQPAVDPMMGGLEELPPELAGGALPPEAMALPPEGMPPMTDVAMDPVAGEVIPVGEEAEPTVDELIALQEAGVIS